VQVFTSFFGRICRSSACCSAAFSSSISEGMLRGWCARHNVVAGSSLSWAASGAYLCGETDPIMGDSEKTDANHTCACTLLDVLPMQTGPVLKLCPSERSRHPTLVGASMHCCCTVKCLVCERSDACAMQRVWAFREMAFFLRVIRKVWICCAGATQPAQSCLQACSVE
jgi:hypothetical protein